MKRSWPSIATLLILATVVTAAHAQTYTFADIPWGATPSQVVSALRAKGYKDIAQRPDGDIGFAGAYGGFEAVGLAAIANGALVKIRYALVTPDEKAIRCYDDLRETLAKKYGAPSMTIRNFTAPYFDGDGFEDTAIRLGKAEFASLWLASDCEACGLAVSISERLTVSLEYESPAWNGEAERRRAAEADDF